MAADQNCPMARQNGEADEGHLHEFEIERAPCCGSAVYGAGRVIMSSLSIGPQKLAQRGRAACDGMMVRERRKPR
jgi:hypothetical protein